MNHFAKMLEEFTAWMNAEIVAGRMTPEVHAAATRARLGLWACANNDPIPPVLLRGLGEDTEKLKRAADALEVAAMKIVQLKSTLQTARMHLVTLGGEDHSEWGDRIQAAVLREIDAILTHT